MTTSSAIQSDDGSQEISRKAGQRRRDQPRLHFARSFDSVSSSLRLAVSTASSLTAETVMRYALNDIMWTKKERFIFTTPWTPLK
ncbi:hypothetical protein TSAR_001860 [Trichomalopsis sarcophagae]|uniref:Uncharacterized protein n=1 Tax=Trichomalopsis sarcophagae TaxID=543379 RepID=A0A232FIL2_9HYME|nr:hypothetical protein TSAR_001860 [Trichomalopsis sarcophagae]